MDKLLKTQIIKKSQIANTRKMLNEYLLELSQFDKTITFDETGMPIYQWFDFYWKEKERFPLYLKLDDKVAGFALIRKLDKHHYEIAEFYILPDYRRNGYGLLFAHEIAKTFHGIIEFSTVTANVKAVNFWDKFSSQFTVLENEIEDSRKNWKIKV